MNRRKIGFAVWLLSAACLYFFENNMGTRTVLICSVLFPALPLFRNALFGADENAPSGKVNAARRVYSRVPAEAWETFEVRPYVPGDSVKRIHWKLSAKRDELLVRDTAAAREEEETPAISYPKGNGKKLSPKGAAALCAAAACLCLALLFLIPAARGGAREMCNRLFDASESVNAYIYTHFPVPEHRSAALAAALSAAALSGLIAAAALLSGRALALGIAAALSLFQVYFGLSFPAWANIALYALAALWMMKRPFRWKTAAAFIAAVLLVSLPVTLLAPGVDTVTEAASESFRDSLSRLTGQAAAADSESPEGLTETRRAHTRSAEEGDGVSRTERAFRPVTVEETQISMPYWTDVVKIVLLLLLSVALVTLPFAPFLVLNARKKRAEEARRAFASGDVGEAVCAVFREVILWLTETGHGGGNLLYRDWTKALPPGMPEGYASRFALCAGDFEEAAYSGHTLPEDRRTRALALLQETGTALWETAGTATRLRLKYWMCLCG